MKRTIAILIAIFVLAINSVAVKACDEGQSNNYVGGIIFGNDQYKYASDENAKMLLDAIYICSEQANGLGQEKIDYLKKKKVRNTPSINDINIKSSELLECSHICWDYEYVQNKKVRNKRKAILQNTVNTVFDFGAFNKIFGSKSGKCNSFSAFLYYIHILSDYLANDPDDTETLVNNSWVEPYCGQPFVEINGGQPSFTAAQKKLTDSFASYSPLDSLGRCGVAIAVLGPDLLAPPNSRADSRITPSGWSQEEYPGIINYESPYIYNRCHLIAHALAGNDTEVNLITGTRYLNESGMKPFEESIGKYIKETNNHVLYRVTPIFVGNNLVASGVQLEAYSIEDKGSIQFNMYCYNIQPGIDINYTSGKNELADNVYNSHEIIPFAVLNAGDDNPDLIFEINKHLDILLSERKRTMNYNMMMGDINTLAYDARLCAARSDTSGKAYLKMKQYEYKYYQILKTYVPILLRDEKFFYKVFK